MSALAQSRPASGRVLLPAFVERFRRWRDRLELRARIAGTRAELSRLTDRELDDLGLTRWDIDRVARQAVLGR